MWKRLTADVVASTGRKAPAAAGFSTAPPSRRLTLLSVLGHSHFSLCVWSAFLLMSCIMILHNLVLQSWGIGTFASITERIERQGEQGFFRHTPLYDAKGKPSLLGYARTPAGRLMHVLPAGLWSVIAPLQLSPTFRTKYHTAHRLLGRLFILISISISFGLLPIVLNAAGKAKRSVAADGNLLVCGTYFLVTGLLAAFHARNRRFDRHRVWILRHVAMGYSVHMQRLLGGLTWWIVPHVWPGYADLTPEGAEKRRQVFGLYFLWSVALNVMSMEVWLRHTTSSGFLIVKGESNKTTP